MMTDELILHLWEAFVGDTTLTARPLNDDDKIAFANAVLNAAKESDARRREKSATHEPVTFTPWDSLPWKPKPIGFAQRSDIELYAKVLTIRPPDAKHDVALFTRDQLQRAVSAALKEFEGMHWVDLDKTLAAPASAGVEEFPLPEMAGLVERLDQGMREALHAYNDGDGQRCRALLMGTLMTEAKNIADSRAALRSYSASLGLQARTEGKQA